ncbi:FMN-binding protein [Streptomyces sp. FB2]|uniref:FMN-binding protein n=1 Tax=Streptomyces sp. FB2 TaxID=2902454 RepID=UPI001F3C979A|nr:FMN-binding protein [Streptomyces sp. FB2]MCF2536079.1 FMN-binding protein [Streptomyces sp. FB2]
MAVRRAALMAASSVTGLVLLLSLKPHHTTPPALAGTGPGAATSSPGPGSGRSGHSTVSSGGGAGANGTFTGAVEQTPYGPVQVAVTLSHGKLAEVRALQTPSGDARSRAIAGYAVPTLTREALGAQSADIQAVSGASYTSEGYMQSLQSALDRAGA